MAEQYIPKLRIQRTKRERGMRLNAFAT